MRINKWSATVAAVAVLLGGSVAAEPGKAKAEAQHSAQTSAREEAKDRHREMEGAAQSGERATVREEHSKGAETSTEMRERRDERKEIKEQYGAGDADKSDNAGKKPWWKFWGSDDES